MKKAKDHYEVSFNESCLYPSQSPTTTVTELFFRWNATFQNKRGLEARTLIISSEDKSWTFSEQGIKPTYKGNKLFQVNKGKKFKNSFSNFDQDGLWFFKVRSKKLVLFPKKKNDLRVCHQVDSTCTSLDPFFCHQCPYGWYEFNSCPEGGMKACGTITCGGKGRPACRRGERWSVEEVSLKGCQGKRGFCQQGLRLDCDENGQQVCL